MATNLTDGFRELLEVKWSEFVEREQNTSASNSDSLITGLVRACVKGNLRAIQTALDRIDGKIAQEIDIEMPKFYTVYPNATIAADDASIIDADTKPEDLRADVLPDDEELPTGSLRPVLERMLNDKKEVVAQILGSAKLIDEGNLQVGNPYVKSVMIAGFMKLIHDGRMSAVFEVLEQIDGKVKETYKVLGDDVYLTSYSTIAPAGAVKNKDGIYQLEATTVTNSWVARLEQTNKRGGR